MWLVRALFIFTSFIWVSQMKKVIKNGTMLVWIVLAIIWFYKISHLENFEVTYCKELLMGTDLQAPRFISRRHHFVSKWSSEFSYVYLQNLSFTSFVNFNVIKTETRLFFYPSHTSIFRYKFCSFFLESFRQTSFRNIMIIITIISKYFMRSK